MQSGGVESLLKSGGAERGGVKRGGVKRGGVKRGGVKIGVLVGVFSVVVLRAFCRVVVRRVVVCCVVV